MKDEESFESELRRVKPSAPPAELLERLQSSGSTAPARRASARVQWPDLWRLLLRWVAPATALLAVVCMVWRVNSYRPPDRTGSEGRRGSATTALKADDVNIDRE